MCICAVVYEFWNYEYCNSNPYVLGWICFTYVVFLFFFIDVFTQKKEARETRSSSKKHEWTKKKKKRNFLKIENWNAKVSIFEMFFGKKKKLFFVFWIFFFFFWFSILQLKKKKCFSWNIKCLLNWIFFFINFEISNGFFFSEFKMNWISLTFGLFLICFFHSVRSQV